MPNLEYVAAFMGVLLFSVSLHELMHAYIAYQLGDDLAHSQGRISLNPIAHIDPLLTIILPLVLLLAQQPPILAAKPVPINTSRIKGGDTGLAIVGLAGPLTNLALAFIGGMLYSIVNPVDGTFLELIMGLFILVNVSLFVFNMLPIPPLDGSRVLYAVAPEGVKNVMRQIESFGIMGLVVFLVVAGPVIQPIISTMRSFILSIVVR